MKPLFCEDRSCGNWCARRNAYCDDFPDCPGSPPTDEPMPEDF